MISLISSFALISSCRNHHGDHLLSVNELEKLRQEFNLPSARTFKLDRSYLRYLFSLDTLRFTDQIKNHYQPVQACYYDKSGHLISFHINCYANPVKEGEDFYWNQKNAFATFVPMSVAPLDSIISLDKHLSFIKTFDSKPIDTAGYSVFDYTAIIHWSKKLYPTGAIKLVKIINENTALAKSKTINIIYVNNDDLW